VNHIVFHFSDRFWRKRQAAMRFNSAFYDGIEKFREQIGIIKADHAARGLLKSGATIKRGLAAYEAAIGEALEICFAYINAQTEHLGWKRRKHIALLDALLSAYAERYNQVLVEHCVKIAASGSGDAAEAAESRRKKLNKALHDKIQQYSEGIGGPKQEKWINRHSIAAGAIISGIGILVAYAFGLVGIK
jgi:hypothetical protein